MLKCPCTQYCTRRFGGCVSECSEYAEYEAEREQERKKKALKRDRDRVYDEYKADTLIRGERRKLNKRRTVWG